MYNLLLPKSPLASKYTPADELVVSATVNLPLTHQHKPFHLHGGPPFANGDLHLGHALNLTLKDVTVRYKQLLGYNVRFEVGWDGHGLPLEQRALKDNPDLAKNPAELRKACLNLAEQFSQEQALQMQRFGVCADYAKSYHTWHPKYEAAQLRMWATLQEKNLVYQALRPVFWSTAYQTALAEAELEYQDVTGEGVTFSLPGKLADGTQVDFVVYTTQPWTLLANEGLAFNPRFTYKLANGLVQLQAEGTEVSLVGATYHVPWCPQWKKLVPADYVDNSGTGLVHLAPGHGKDDYQAGLAFNLPVTNVLNVYGKVEAKEVQGTRPEVNTWVKAQLGTRVVKTVKLTHSYPHCWRSHTPVVTRAVPQWFVNVEPLKPGVLEQAQQVQFVPPNTRFSGTVAQRGDWCVSRQRVWGVPLPVFYKDGVPWHSAAATHKLANLVEVSGTNVWWAMKTLEQALDVPAGYVRGSDTMDVWLDSGTSCAAVLQGATADLYLEGSDQHRGWFQSSAWVSEVLFDKLPYRAVWTHGFVVGPDKAKLSKSHGAKPLKEYVAKYGADTVRLWAVSSDVTADVTFSQTQLDQAAERYRLFRNSLKVLSGNLQTPVHPTSLSLWGSSYAEELHKCHQQWQEHMAKVEYHLALNQVANFLTVQLSKVYLESVKDTLYCDPETSSVRREAVYLLDLTLKMLLNCLYPFVPHLVHQLLKHHYNQMPSLQFPAASPSVWEEMCALRNQVNGETEKLRQQKLLGKNTEAKVALPKLLLTPEQTADVLGVSEVTNGAHLLVALHDGHKCPRCWKFHRQLTDLCLRCTSA